MDTSYSHKTNLSFYLSIFCIIYLFLLCMWKHNITTIHFSFMIYNNLWHMMICFFVYLSVCLSVYLSICLFIHFFHLSICLHVYLIYSSVSNRLISLLNHTLFSVHCSRKQIKEMRNELYPAPPQLLNFVLCNKILSFQYERSSTSDLRK